MFCDLGSFVWILCAFNIQLVCYLTNSIIDMDPNPDKAKYGASHPDLQFINTSAGHEYVIAKRIMFGNRDWSF